jgi:hypothetical protein
MGRAIAAVVTMLAVAGVAGLGTLVVLRARNDAIARANTEVRDRARLAAQTMLDTLNSDLGSLLATSRRPQVNHAIVFSQYGGVDPYFSELLAANPRFVTASVYDKNGRLVLRLPRDPSIAGRLFRQQEYFSVARSTGLPHVSGMFVQLGPPKVPVIAYSIRVFHHGGTYGVIVGTTPITAFDTLLAPLTPAGWTIRVYNEPGQEVSPSSEATGKIYTTDPVVGPALKGTAGFHRNKADVVAAEPVTGYGWAVVVTEPVKQADAGGRRLTRRLSWLAGGATALALVAAAAGFRARRVPAA